MTRRLEPPLHPVMAVGAEFLRRRRHRSRAFMLGMALDAAPLRLVEGLGEARENLFARPRRMPRGEQHRGRGVCVRPAHRLVFSALAADARPLEIRRVSCTELVCLYV